VPVTIAIMCCSVLPGVRPGVVNWSLAISLPPGAHLAMLTLLISAIGVFWEISWVTWASDYSPSCLASVSSTSCSCMLRRMFVPRGVLAILVRRSPALRLNTDPANGPRGFLRRSSVQVLLLFLHGPIATNILNVYARRWRRQHGLRSSAGTARGLVAARRLLVTIYFLFGAAFAKASITLYQSPCCVMKPVAGS